MEPYEMSRVELRFQGVHRFAKQVRLLSHMEAHVIACCLAPFNLGGPDKMDAACRSNKEAFRPGDARPVRCLRLVRLFRPFPQRRGERHELSAELTGTVAMQLIACV